MKIQAFLKTPLYRGSYGAKRNQELEANVVEVHGKSSEAPGGLRVQISALFDGKGNKVKAPFSTIFLPLSKIDYYVEL